MVTMPRARTYNQNHVARPRTGGRRVSIYWSWAYPWEAQRDPAAMENRFSTITEVRNVAWPAYETPEYDATNFLQGIAGTLELFHRSTLDFQALAEDRERFYTGNALNWFTAAKEQNRGNTVHIKS